MTARVGKFATLAVALSLLLPAPGHAREVTLDEFLGLLDPARRSATFAQIEANWTAGLTAPLLEVGYLTADDDDRQRIWDLLAHQTGQRLGTDRDAWYQWLWQTAPDLPSWYARFKGRLYAVVDSRFAEYFDHHPKTTIRLDEIRWGGVRRDGIPPLDHPKLLDAAAATYLAEDDVVFGVSVNGDERAYPKRILAWHEMVKDRIAGREFNGVYCTLCGSMILYEADLGGKHYELGTSGFLYRSNKLMYDHATKSLWSTLSGEPVVGPLVGQGLKLHPRAVVVTRWGEWRRRHPATKVLSLDTGHSRNYAEGVAYHDYFATDDLMFTVPGTDRRLKNKADVLALRFGPAEAPPVAIAQGFLERHPIHAGRLGATDYVVFTDASGANRVFQSGQVPFTSLSADSALAADGTRWRITEAALEGPNGRTLPRLPAHRAFWFGWRAAYPDTRLIQ